MYYIYTCIYILCIKSWFGKRKEIIGKIIYSKKIVIYTYPIPIIVFKLHIFVS